MQECVTLWNSVTDRGLRFYWLYDHLIELADIKHAFVYRF